MKKRVLLLTVYFSFICFIASLFTPFPLLQQTDALAGPDSPFPVPAVDINGKDAGIQVKVNETFNINLSLDTQGLSEKADWWLLHVTPEGAIEYFDLSVMAFRPGILPAHQGEMVSFNSAPLNGIACSSPGIHTFYFGIDLDLNGKIDVSNLFYNSAILTVFPEGAEDMLKNVLGKASGWINHPVHGTVVEIGYGGPEEYNTPPYPSVQSLTRLSGLGVQVIALEFQYAWTIYPPYMADETQFSLLKDALDNVEAAGLYAVVAVRNGPGRNAMMPDIADKDVITVLYQDENAQAAYVAMLKDVVSRLKDRPEIIAWEPIVEPALDWFGRSPFPQGLCHME